MNGHAWFWWVTAAVIGRWAVECLAAWLNARSVTGALPAAAAGIYDEAEYRRSQAYTKATIRLGQIDDALSTGLLLGFWWLGGFGWLDGWVRGWGWGDVATGLGCLALLGLARTVAALPLEVYGTFVVEERFGFNRTTASTFVADRLKALALSGGIGLPLLALVLWIFAVLPQAWLWGWVAVTAFSLAISFVAPTWLLPLFHRFTPLPEGALREAIESLARRCGFPLREVLVMDGSKRSTKSNAFFTGFGRNKRIALYDTLVQRHGIPELVAVLAHEIGHWRRHHLAKGLVFGVAGTGVLFGLLDRVMEDRGLFDAFGVRETSVYLSLVFFGILAQPLQLVIAMLGQALSRRWEYEADAFAAGVTGDPAPLVAALRQISREHLSHLNPHPLHVVLHHSHPPVLRRIEALNRLRPEAG